MKAVIFVATILISIPAMAELSVAPSISDSMVFQRGQPIVVWGTAGVNAAVVVTLGRERVEGVADGDGGWRVLLKPRQASSSPVQLTVASGSEAIVTSDILVGDVWFCAGQSNMAMKVSSAAGRDEAGKGAGDSLIRFLNLSRRPFTKPIVGKAAADLVPTPENKRKYYKISPWSSCDSKQVSSLSAVAYWFARPLQKELGVPIGLIVPPVGGSAAQAWVSRASIEADPELRPLLDRWIQDEPERLQKQLMPWLKANPGATFDDTPLHRHRPTTLFETAVEPMSQHAIKGVIWYQGEQNAQNAVQSAWFTKSYPALVRDFRANWGQSKLPFYAVQLPGFGGGNSELWPEFREQQRAFQSIPDTGMAVTIDLGDGTNIHPKDKPPIGQRLALLALANTYGKKVLASGPVPERVTANGHVVSIRFGSVGSGLKAGKDGAVPGFEIAGADGAFVSATARIDSNNTILVQAVGITTPKQIRYAWAPFPRPLSLHNSGGLPAGPFLEMIRE